ncbi:hypothetical protein DSO57_1034889 [Entomophthora muscae]|uniref:Uncharacterized protein n=1 Tax=Entomophthora muscae TaxID=34485 RepID=A0ACC2SD31_9FUNG|nr:hypothetical protein DSO57_1034889 [Entomophthora muscae]
MELLLAYMPVRYLAGRGISFAVSAASVLFFDAPDLKIEEIVKPICEILYLRNSVTLSCDCTTVTIEYLAK